MSRGYLVVYEHRTEGYSSYAPDLPGCISTGASLKEMQRSMRETINAHLVGLAEHEEKAPQPATTIVHFPHPSEGHGIDHWVVERVEVDVLKIGNPRRQSRGQTKRSANDLGAPADPSTASATQTSLRMTSFGD
jgi:predicted RNase H-like HicB family nuclease